jgi:hypothetical protein
MSRTLKSRIASTSLAAFAALVLGGASGGSCPGVFAFLKSSSAAAPSPDAGLGDFATLSQCASFATYRSVVDPVFQRMCIACHASGGRGTANLTFAATTSDEDSKIAANFTAALTELLDDDQGNLDSNPILARLNGTISHDITLDIAGDDYAAMRQWVGEEREIPCTSGTTTASLTAGR